MVKKIIKDVLPILVFILIVLLALSECQRRNERQLAVTNLTVAFDSVTYFKNILNTQTASVKVLQLHKRNLEDLVLKKDSQLLALTKEFASIKSVTNFKTVTKLDTVYIQFKKDIPCSFTITDSIRSKFYSFSYSIDSTRIQLKDFIIPNETTVITGFKRKWLLGKQTLTTDITHSNPHITTESIMSAEVIIPEPWYKKWYVWLAAGIVTGTLIK